MTDLPPDLMDQPIPTDTDIADCPECRRHCDNFTDSMNARIQAVTAGTSVHASTALLGWYRIFHMRQHREGRL